jgi:hypothetical protein
MASKYQVCTLCGGAGHKMSNCKELSLPPEGFFKPSGGGHCHDDDCDDEKLRTELLQLASTLFNTPRSKYRWSNRKVTRIVVV